jgi:predicted DNA-binding WGR domain protein
MTATILFLKATQLKTITVPAYVKRDGTVVPAHNQLVHYNPDAEVHDIVSGKGSHSQKIAHKKLMAKPGFKDLPVDHQFAHILSHATDIQKEASNSAALSLWTTAYAEGKTPSTAQQLVFSDLPLDKKLVQIGKAEAKGAKDYVVSTLKKDAILTDAFGSDPVPAQIDLWLSGVLAGVAPNFEQKDAMMHFMLDHGMVGAKVINAASAIVGKEKFGELIKHTPKKERAVDPHSIPGVAGWHASLVEGKVPTVEQHQAVTDAGFDAAYKKVTQGNSPQVIANLNSLIDQSANQWLNASSPSNPSSSVIGGVEFEAVQMTNQKNGEKYWLPKVVATGKVLDYKSHDSKPKMWDYMTHEAKAVGAGWASSFGIAPQAQETATPNVWHIESFTHTSKGHKVYAVPIPFKMGDEEYKAHAEVAKKHGGFYSSYAKDGAIKGFHFKTELDAQEFVKEAGAGVTFFMPAGALVVDDPKEGDTKTEDGKQYILMNGRWHSLDEETGTAPADDVSLAEIAAFQTGSFYQKEAHKKLSASDGWADVPAADKLVALKELYSQLQGAASHSAAISLWKKAAFDGKNPTLAQWKAYLSLEEPKQKEIFNLVDKKVGSTAHLKPLVSKDAPPELVTPQVAPQVTPQVAEPAWKPMQGKNHWGFASGFADGTVFADGTGAKYQQSQSNGDWKFKKKGFSQWQPIQNSVWTSALNDGKTPNGDSLLVDTGPSAAETLLAQKQKQEAPKIVATKPLTVSVKQTTYEMKTEGHNKFWAAHVVGNNLITVYGKIGTKGQSTTKEFSSELGANVAMGKLMTEKEGKGYKYAGTQDINVNLEAPATAPESPKEGDTKQGVDGTLVFHDGRWHLQEKKLTPSEKKSAALTAALESIQIPDFLALDKHVNAKNYPPLAQSIMAATVLNGAAGFKTYVTAYEGGMFASKPGAAGFKTNKCSPDKGTARQKAFATFCAQIKAVLDAHKGVKPKSEGTPSPAAQFSQPTPSPTTAKAIKLPGIKVGTITAPDIKGWEQTGPQKGSNTGGQYKDKNGQQWYCKFPADPDVVKNEFIAAKFYQMLGVAVPNLKLISKDGKLGIASKWVDGLSVVDAPKLAKAKGVHDAFAIDAWLANWDVVGLGNDNLMMSKDGAVHVDVGGSLLYRAQGGAKGDAFGPTVPELDTLLDKKLNPKTAAVYGKVTEESMQFGLQQLNKIKPSQIEELCEKVGPGTVKEQQALAKTLIARRAFILKKYGIRDQWNEKPVDESKLSVNPSDLPKAIDFVNYKGAGQGLSGSKHVNENNTKDSEAMIAFALKGNLTALKEYKYTAVNKETGEAIGKVSITDHPAKLIKEQWSGLVELLQSVAHPPKDTLPLPSVGSAGSVEDISDMVGSFNPSERVETVAAEHRMGFFMKLGQIDDVSELLEGYKWHFLTKQSAWVKECYNGFSKLSSAVKAYVGAVQSSGWINHVFSQGKKTVSASGNGGKFEGGVQTLAAKVYKDAVEIPEGVIMYRGMSDNTAGKSMTQQFLNAKPGLIIQNTDSMCSSYNENHSWGGGVQLKIRCSKGSKGIPSFASGNYGSEHEITTLPGQRFVVLGVEKSGSGVKVDVLMLPPHDGYVAELGKLEALGKALMMIFRGK